MSSRSRFAAILMVVAALFPVCRGLPQARAQSPSTDEAAARRAPAPTEGATEPLDAMKADLARMRVILGQMQNNIGFVGSTTSPLYHQFSLEIDMWQMLITQMQRRIDAMEKESRKPR